VADLPDADNPSRIARLVAEAVATTQQRLAPMQTQLRDEFLSRWREDHEADAAQLARSVLGELAQHPDLPPEARPVFDLLTKPEHQTQAVLTVLGVYPIVSAFVMAAVQPYVQDIANLSWSHHTSQPLSPAEAALAALRGNWTAEQARTEAALSGIDGSRFDILELNTGEPPGLQQLLEAFRRGIIKEDRLVRGIRQSRVRNEWVDVIEALRFAPVNVGEVLAGAVQNHLTPADARERIAQAGVDPANFDWLFATHGRPPGVVELGELVNRGEMSDDDWSQAVRESDIKDKYIPFLRALRRRLMPERTVVSAVRQGVLTADEGLTHLRALGFSDADAHTLVSEASSTKTTHIRQISESQTLNLYAQRLIDKPSAVARLTTLGYTSDEITLVVALADHEHHARFQAAALNRVHTLFVAHKITATEVATDLDKIGYDASDRADLVELWTAERDANVRTLTEAQLQGLAARDQITFAEFIAETVAMGYSRKDARRLYFLAFPATKQPTNVPAV